VIDSLVSNTVSLAAPAEDWSATAPLFLHNPIATIVFEKATWRILTANPAACRLYAYRSSEFSGMSLLDLVSKPTGAPFGPADFELRAMFLNRAEPWAHQCKDGREILVETTLHSLKWEGKDAYLLFVLDKTESVLSQQRLLDALQKAEGALQARAGLLSAVSHGIRTPMNGVMGMAGMLAETKLSREQRDFVGTIKSCGELLLTAIDGILDFTKAGQNELALEVLDFDLAFIVEDVMDVIEVAAHQKRLGVRTFIAPDVPLHLTGDGGRLRQILINLLANAVKFTECGWVSLSIRTAEGAKSPKLLFEVQDTGIGLREQQKARLFQSFGGGALGLAISQRLVAIMDGDIGVTSQPGEGSTFWFTARFLPGSKVVWARPKLDLLKGAEILVVQTNTEDRDVTRLLLEEMGMQVTEAGDASQALSLCSARGDGSSRFAFCLVDSSLPLIDGMEFARILREQPYGEKTRIVMTVARWTPEQAAEGQKIGINGFLVRPLRKSRLASALSRAGSLTAESAGKNAAPLGRSGGPAAILLVEDNLVNQKVASHSLLKLGYSVEIASNGLKAIDAFQRRQFDLILMDCHMPVMDGYAATQRIRSCGISGRYVPIIAMTADVLDTQRQRCIAAGMNDFLAKPVKREILSGMLEHWLAQA